MLRVTTAATTTTTTIAASAVDVVAALAAARGCLCFDPEVAPSPRPIPALARKTQHRLPSLPLDGQGHSPQAT